ncbi:MAG: TlpA disulfide reductase family protein [Paludibacter sp.]
MKKIVYVLLSVLSLASCKDSSFTINGSVEQKELNDKKVFLRERISREWKTIDSTTITNLKFTFKGVIDTSKITYLVYQSPQNKRVRQAFVLENGNIFVSVDTSGFMTFKGTAQNEKLQTYQNLKNEFNKKVDKFVDSRKDSIKTPEQKAAFDKETQKFNTEEVGIDKKFTIENINSLVGNHVFMNSFFGFSLTEKEEIVKLMNQETKNVKRIQEIIADMEVEKKVAVGQSFTDINLLTPSGQNLALSDLVGKTDFVLVDFWASWCGPCMEFLPELQAFYAKHKGTSFEIYGVSLDDSKDAWVTAIKSHKIEWKLVSDLKGWKCEGARAYAVNSIPCTILIDKNGKIVGKNLSISELEKILSKKDDKK